MLIPYPALEKNLDHFVSDLMPKIPFHIVFIHQAVTMEQVIGALWGI